MEQDGIYRAAVYLRLSKEDGDKPESDSIANQKEYIREFLKDREDIVICEERVDDGYSGVSFDRPAFQLMLEDIKAGRINCIVVKDLSRFGRNYIEAGRYIEKIFPFLGVRFIAVNDNYDSNREKTLSDCLLIPFKNLINEAYANDISVKIRSQLDLKRRRGEFIGSFAAYGYFKSDTDRHRLIVDEYAANVVRDIFKWKLSGMNCGQIADKLNEYGILSPLEYKESLGLNYATGFKTGGQASWSAVSVLRILRNRIYTGVLEQGKEGTPNYKIRKKLCKPEEEWIRVAGTHEAIIPEEDFLTVSSLLRADTRIAPGNSKVYPLSGLLRCGGCGHGMIRRTVPGREKKYVYYICSHNKAYRECSCHRIRADRLEGAVFHTLRSHIGALTEEAGVSEASDNAGFQQVETRKQLSRILRNRSEAGRYKRFIGLLKEDLAAHIITETEYGELRLEYMERLIKAQAAFRVLLREYESTVRGKPPSGICREELQSGTNSEKSRSLAVSFIQVIRIYEGGRIHIELKYGDEFKVYGVVS